MEAAEYERMFAAEDRHWWYAGVHDLVLRFARREARRGADRLKMLDAGCGTGRLCQLLEPLGEVTGCDIHPPALELAARRGVTRLQQCDLADPALGTGQYDLITSIDVLYHRRVQDEEAALRNLHRALRPGGMFILQLPAFECLRGTHDVAVHTRRRYRRAEVARLLESAGFRVERVTCRLFPFFLPMLFWRLASRTLLHATDAPRASDVAHSPAPLLNRALLSLVRFENRLLAAGLCLPVGTSIFAVARRPA